MLSDRPSLSEVWAYTSSAGGRRAEGFFERAFADQDQVHVGPIGELVQERLQQPVRSLDLAQSAHVPDRERAPRDSQLGPGRPTRRVRLGLERDAVGDHRHARAAGRPAQDVLPHLVAARHQHVGGPRGQRGRMALLPLGLALLVERRHHPRLRAQRPHGDAVEPGAEIVRVQHRRLALVQLAADPHQGWKAHAVDGEQLHGDALLERQLADRAVLSQGEDGGLDAAAAAARRELDYELLQPAEPQPIDEVRDPDGHAWKVGTAPYAGYADCLRNASMATPPRINASAPTARGATLSPARAAPRPTATTGFTYA